MNQQGGQWPGAGQWPTSPTSTGQQPSNGPVAGQGHLVPVVQGPGSPAATGSPSANPQVPWPSPVPPAPTAPSADDSQPRGGLLSFGARTILSTALVGALAGLSGALLQGLVLPTGNTEEIGAGLLAVLLTSITAGLLAALPHMAARAWDKAAINLLLGAALGGVLGAGSLLAVDHFYDGWVGKNSTVPLWVILVVWVAIAATTGIAGGALRSLRGVFSGIFGGLIGGLLGGWLFWGLTSPRTGKRGQLLIDGLDARTLVAITTASLLIGVCIGAADRVTRRCAITITEGNRRRNINLDRLITTVGSARGSSVVVRDPLVAARHLTISVRAKTITVTIHSPTLDRYGNPIPGGTLPVGPGDVLSIGSAFIRFEET